MTLTTIPIWLDCDPGHDDAVAILLACFHPAFKLYGISACYGNSSPENTFYNARSLLTAMGKIEHIPVYKGAQKPWIRKSLYAPDIHGLTGLDGTALLPVPADDGSILPHESFLDAMEEAIVLSEGEMTLICTGAMTSVATLFRTKPHLKSLVKYICMMGGGIGIGNCNVNRSAEFNLWVDPQAANSIFTDQELKDKCILIPLNLTHQALATSKVLHFLRMDPPTSNIRKLYADLFEFFKTTYKNVQGFEKGPPVHDPLTLIPLLELYGWDTTGDIGFRYERMELYVIDDELDLDLGKLNVLKQYPADIGQGVIVGLHIHIPYFWEQFNNCLTEAEKISTI